MCVCSLRVRNGEYIRTERLSDERFVRVDRLSAVFPKDYHFLAIRGESNGAALYITGVPALGQDLPGSFVSFVAGARRTRKASPGRRRGPSRKDCREEIVRILRTDH